MKTILLGLAVATGILAQATGQQTQTVTTAQDPTGNCLVQAVEVVASQESGNLFACNRKTGSWYAVGPAAPFSSLTGGTNTGATMTVGTGASLGTSGSGAINATSVPGTGVTGIAANSVLCNPTGATAAGVSCWPSWLAIQDQLLQIPSVPSTLSPPAISYNSSAMASPQTFYPIASAGAVLDTTHYGYFGASSIGPAFSTSIQLRNASVTEGLIANPPFWTNVYYSGSGFDLIHAPGGQTYDVWIDGTYMGHFAPYYNQGTAAAGGASTITLAAGASSADGYYNQNYVTITGGTGSGQVRQIASYVGSTKVATVSVAWVTPPDATSTYSVQGDPGKYCVSGNACTAIDAAGASDKYINFSFSGIPAQHLIQVMTTAFGGFNIGQNDSLAPATPSSRMRVIIVGDSFIAGTGSAFANPPMASYLAQYLGLQGVNQGVGGSGWCNPSASLGGVNFMDRIGPPAESWTYSFNNPAGGGATGGTYKISVTYGGSTQTTGTIAYNAPSGTIQTAVQALSNLPSNSVTVGGQYTTGANNVLIPWVIILHSAPGATLSIDTTGLTGTPLLTLNQWTGVVAPNIPTLNGTALPFLLYVQGSGNDTGYTATQVGACATAAAQYIVAHFPTAVTVFAGVVASDGGSISQPELDENAAIKAAAQILPKINGSVPFIDTFSAGLGGNPWIFGSSTVASPTNAKNDILKGTITTAHPTGNGHQYLAQRMAAAIKALFGVY